MGYYNHLKCESLLPSPINPSEKRLCGGRPAKKMPGTRSPPRSCFERSSALTDRSLKILMHLLPFSCATVYPTLPPLLFGCCMMPRNARPSLRHIRATRTRTVEEAKMELYTLNGSLPRVIGALDFRSFSLGSWSTRGPRRKDETST